jgi:hypothetical protein
MCVYVRKHPYVNPPKQTCAYSPARYKHIHSYIYVYTYNRSPAEVVDDLCVQLRDPQSALLRGTYTSKAAGLEIIDKNLTSYALGGGSFDGGSFLERCACVHVH